VSGLDTAENVTEIGFPLGNLPGGRTCWGSFGSLRAGACAKPATKRASTAGSTARQGPGCPSVAAEDAHELQGPSAALLLHPALARVVRADPRAVPQANLFGELTRVRDAFVHRGFRIRRIVSRHSAPPCFSTRRDKTKGGNDGGQEHWRRSVENGSNKGSRRRCYAGGSMALVEQSKSRFDATDKILFMVGLLKEAVCSSDQSLLLDAFFGQRRHENYRNVVTVCD
jgi:hypothetical protein